MFKSWFQRNLVKKGMYVCLHQLLMPIFILLSLLQHYFIVILNLNQSKITKEKKREIDELLLLKSFFQTILSDVLDF